MNHITLRRLDRIHRFVRLWRKLPWTVDELDYVLTQLAIPDTVRRIDPGRIRIGVRIPATAGTSGPFGIPATPEKPGTLEKILDLVDLNAEWSLPIDELVALSGALLDLNADPPVWSPIRGLMAPWDVFPPKGLREPASLFDRLFNQPPFLDRDGRWPPPPESRFVHPAWKKTNIPHGFSDPNNNTLTRLLAGLQVGDKELVTLVESVAAIPAIDYRRVTVLPAGTVFFALPDDPANQAIKTRVVRNVAAYVALAKSTDSSFTTTSDPADIDALHGVLKDVSGVDDKL